MTTGRTAAFHTLGCKVNRYETDAVIRSFTDHGYDIRDFDSICDVYVINTCTVTSEASRKSGQFVRRARRANPDAVIVAMGCQIQMSGRSEHADILIGSKDKIRAVEEVERFINNKKSSLNEQMTLLADISKTGHFEEIGPVSSFENTRAFIKIEDGCNRFCSYCIIPYARGRVRSRDEDDILREIRGAADSGFNEVVLTGIDLSAYGSDENKDISALAALTEKISGIEGIRRIRLGSLEPYSMSREFITRLGRIEKLCPHFHLSLQSGSDTVLMRMNREYDTGYFRDTLSNLRDCIKNVKFTADLITGFPGETEDEHRQTAEFCQEMDLMDIHVFKYSRREGTRAAKMICQIPADIVNRRSRELTDIAGKLKFSHMERAVGHRFNVLIEKTTDEQSEGYTENYIPVVIENADEKSRQKPEAGDIVPVTAVFADVGSIRAKF